MTSPEITHFNVSVTASEDTETINPRVNGNTIVIRHSNSLNYRWNTWNNAPRGSMLNVMVEAINAAYQLYPP